MKYPLVIAARMGSSRLPGKTLMKINNREMLGLIIDRVKESDYVGDIILSTTKLEEDDSLVEWAKKEGISYFRGQSFDVLGRLSDTVKFISASSFIEVLGDNPLIDKSIINATCNRYEEGNFDYVSILTKEYPNFCKEDSRLFPIGIRAQVIKAKAIFDANRLAQTPMHREHATTYIIDNPDKFKISLIEAKKTFSELNKSDYTFAVNVKANLEMIKIIVKNLNENCQNWGLKDVMKLTSNNQNILSLMGNEAIWVD